MVRKINSNKYGVIEYSIDTEEDLGALPRKETDNTGVRFNEVCSRNFSSICSSEDGEYYDYVELYNPTEYDISLEGYALSRGVNDKNKFVFGDETIKAISDYFKTLSTTQHGGTYELR